MKKNKEKIKQPVNKGVAKVPVIMQLEALECGAASVSYTHLDVYKRQVVILCLFP